MTDIAIRVENLSKRYRIGQREPYKALRDVLPRLITAPFRLLRRNLQPGIRNPQSDEFIWALKDVSFEVQRGEVVGIPSLRSGQASGAPSASLRGLLSVATMRGRRRSSRSSPASLPVPCLRRGRDRQAARQTGPSRRRDMPRFGGGWRQ